MKKKLACFGIIFAGLNAGLYATDQIYFELNCGAYFYAGIGGKIGWMRFGNNEKVGFICDASYYNNGFVDEYEGDWHETVKIAHNIGLAAGVIFNNMGMDGVLRTSEHIKLKGLYTIWDRPQLVPCLDIGFKLNAFFTEETALTMGIGYEIYVIIPFPYVSLGMIFTL
ncbi:MAG: hypothetical protein LBC72_00100 [Spirochaetaceae bacterium]|jgi:hypothetical protein|nr:hypothetical protein [Spirochaetaceae bacterium]